MLKATLYFVAKNTLPLQISENSEVDLGSMLHLGCNLYACGNSLKVKIVLTIFTRSLVFDNKGILHVPLKVIVATSILV